MSPAAPPRRKKKRGPGRPPRTESRHTRTEILQAAEKLFAADGYHGTSLRRIAKSSNVDLATIKYHYDDKRALYDEAFLLGHQRISESFLTELKALKNATTHEDVHTALQHLAEYSAHLATNDEAFVRLVFFRMLDVDDYSEEIVQAYLEDISTKVRDYLRGPIKRNIIRDIDADALVMFLFFSVPAMCLAARAWMSAPGAQITSKGAQAGSTPGIALMANQLIRSILLPPIESEPMVVNA